MAHPSPQGGPLRGNQGWLGEFGPVENVITAKDKNVKVRWDLIMPILLVRCRHLASCWCTGTDFG